MQQFIEHDEYRPRKRRNTFTPEEDKSLNKLVIKYGENNWHKVARKMPRRDVRQCRERWFNYLSPLVVNGKWTQEEEGLLIEKVHEYGRKWKYLTQFFPGRTDINIKNRYNCLMKYIPRNSSLEEENQEMRNDHENSNAPLTHYFIDSNTINANTSHEGDKNHVIDMKKSEGKRCITKQKEIFNNEMYFEFIMSLRGDDSGLFLE
ncbi:r2r3-MYB transcription factor [Tritrichomonas foetus]|uniref:R2r3-MYB transcription factor n=1 Tax=Tritrichomonas foetus TaxID=1144522 RepID=A0A1J4J634_9EUKA|nr:r2r3-MYB transcription factor [Tritrichomonas foetus]|eukprot:OHS94678.1 r2r3-MYB transcription factor [Tritrichomonas foetus]